MIGLYFKLIALLIVVILTAIAVCGFVYNITH